MFDEVVDHQLAVSLDSLPMQTKTIAVFAAVAVLAACSTPHRLDQRWVQGASKIDAVYDADGDAIEYEYSIRVDTVPPAVHAAMERLYPNAVITAAEHDQERSGVLWELIGQQDGRILKAMFHPDGKLSTVEIGMAPEDAPAAVAGIANTWPGARVTEVLRLLDAAQQHIGFQIKFQHADRLLKAGLDVDGRVLWAARQIPATIEVPLAIE
jgi:hypothetical protein